jgi:hypothetical protein
MFTKRSQTILGIAVVVGLTLLGSWMLTRNVVPAGVQSQESGPTPPTPDFTAFAEAFCCDGTTLITTPSKEQTDLWTEEAVIPTDSFTQPSLNTESPLPVVDYPAPSEDWLDYHDTNFGVSFKYPSNWFVAFTGREVAITNYSLLSGGSNKGFETNPDAIRIDIISLRDLNPNETLDTYVIANNPDATFLEQQPIFTLENGFQVVKATMSQKGFDWRWDMTYVTNGSQVFQTVSEYGKTYGSVQDDLVKTISIP